MSKQKEWEFKCMNCGFSEVLTKRVRKCPSCKTDVFATRTLVGMSQKEADEKQKVLY